jgi:ferritin-like metal-binding protein YciE
MKTLQDLFLDQLADIHYAEHQLVKALPKMAKAATHEQLRDALENHLQETEGHRTKVQRVFEAFDESDRTKKCEAILGLIREAEELVAEHKDSPTINAAIIAGAQKVEHYEIATYGCLREWAEFLGNNDAVTLLEEILEDEKAADLRLTELARALCNGATDEEETESSETSASAASQALRRSGPAVRT